LRNAKLITHLIRINQLYRHRRVSIDFSAAAHAMRDGSGLPIRVGPLGLEYDVGKAALRDLVLTMPSQDGDVATRRQALFQRIQQFIAK
jgi:hypothetical protein